MNSIKNKKELEEKLKSVVRFKNDNDKLVFETEILHLNIINEILVLMEKNNFNKADIAKLLNTSKSYITQLFSGDKLINLKMLAKLQRIFNVKFVFVPVNVGSEQSKNNKIHSAVADNNSSSYLSS
jgi:hypothetical protein